MSPTRRNQTAGLLARVLGALVRCYRLLLSPMLTPRCRFEPSCSSYALEALDTHGAGRGSWLALRRLARCQPLSRGGWDPVPAAALPRPADHAVLRTAAVTRGGASCSR